MALTDTLDDLISDERINPQLAMKILGNFDQAITEALQKNVKARLSFKVSWLGCRLSFSCVIRRYTHTPLCQFAGKPRHVQILRRSMDFPHSKRSIQDGWIQRCRPGRQGQDCQLQRQEAWGDLEGTTR